MPCLIRIPHDLVRLGRVQDSHEIAICKINISSAIMKHTIQTYLACAVRICCGESFSLIVPLIPSKPIPEFGHHALSTHPIRSAVARGEFSGPIIPLSQDRTLRHKILHPNRSVSNLVAYMRVQSFLPVFTYRHARAVLFDVGRPLQPILGLRWKLDLRRSAYPRIPNATMLTFIMYARGTITVDTIVLRDSPYCVPPHTVAVSASDGRAITLILPENLD